MALLCAEWDFARNLEAGRTQLIRNLRVEHEERLLGMIAWRMQADEEGLKANLLSAPDLKSVILDALSGIRGAGFM